MYDAFLLAAAGWAENADRPLLFQLFQLFGLLAIVCAVGVIAYLLIQRLAEFLIGRWRTTTREFMLYTFLIALLCGLLQFILRVYDD